MVKKWADIPKEDRVKSLQEALPACDEDSFSNIKVLLTIACTLPVTVLRMNAQTVRRKIVWSSHDEDPRR